MCTKKAWYWLSALLFIVLLFVVIRYLNSSCRISSETAFVQGDSLHGSLTTGDKVVVEYGYYNCTEPLRGEIAAYRHPSFTAPIVKIIRGVPGDRLEILASSSSTYSVIINGLPQRTSSGLLYELDSQRAKLMQIYVRDYRGVIPADAYLLLGEVPSGTMDSTAIGLIGRNALIGRVQKGD